ncbi:hypothetical protein [Xanthomonas vasicola]|uniref:Uncharacterized protein n=1 Tax=Xanthomonas vasicola TaxID=56459 RepID=A0ABD7S6J3_XANVA|nr:hypothetical protein [Xanthomonas vasicola]MDO6986736.1 hypothetical protein [Xanthomonas vasicola]TWQ26439.1 hypothetical protein FQJ97_00525 [Xanthomonas vasicola]TWQ34103.1 hypothetical protein FQJ96_20315 [Xanthomonas vasicola]TWQ45789.1 hypothetical protein FQK01_24505 [Xanthomonas vasicola]TWQ51238.1 hypothetical protein FQJ94_19000 [Xanthomonas vasicola]
MNTGEFYYIFIKNLLPDSGFIKLKGWEGEIPWTFIFSSLGKSFANEFYELSEENKRNIFSMIEAAMHEEGELANAVATGLLEGLHKSSIKNNLLHNSIIDRLDENSSRYLKNWSEWSGL